MMLFSKLFGKKKETDNGNIFKFDGLEFSYTSEDSGKELQELNLEFDHEIKTDMNILKNKNGVTALMLYVDVPTFDSEDRVWDSYRKLYLIPKDRKITAYVVAGGYRISSIHKYNNIHCKNEKAEQILREAGIFRVSKR